MLKGLYDKMRDWSEGYSKERTVFRCICFRNESDQRGVVEVLNIGEGAVLLLASESMVCGLRSIETMGVKRLIAWKSMKLLTSVVSGSAYLCSRH